MNLQTFTGSPKISGVIIGLLQIVLVLVDGHTLSGSGSYNVISSLLIFTQGLQQRFPYLAKKRKGLNSWWQVRERRKGRR